MRRIEMPQKSAAELAGISDCVKCVLSGDQLLG